MHDGWQLMLRDMQIINFEDYVLTRGRDKMCMEIVKEIQNARKNGHVYGIEEMKPLAEKFLESIKYRGNGAVPIVRIVQECNFITIAGTMRDKRMSGFVSIDKGTVNKYDSDKIIGVNDSDELGHQRFVIAHELAHYLFDYDMSNKPYFDTYIKNSHKSKKEQIANAFATNLLMPAKYFALKFDENINMDSNIKEWTKYFEVQEKAVEKRILEVIANGI